MNNHPSLGFFNSKFTYLPNVLFLFNWHNGALKITKADYCEMIHTAWEKLWFSTNEMQPNGFYSVSRAICAWRNLSGLVFPNVHNSLSVTQNRFKSKLTAFTLSLFNGYSITNEFKRLKRFRYRLSKVSIQAHWIVYSFLRFQCYRS